MQRKKGSINGPLDHEMIPRELYDIIQEIGGLSGIADNTDKAIKIAALTKAIYTMMLNLKKSDKDEFPFQIYAKVVTGTHLFPSGTVGVYTNIEPRVISKKFAKPNLDKLNGVIDSFKADVNRDSVSNLEASLDQLGADLELTHSAASDTPELKRVTEQTILTLTSLRSEFNQLKSDLGFKNSCVIS